MARTNDNGTSPTTTIAEVREVCGTVADRLTVAAWGAPLAMRAELMAEAGRLLAAVHALKAIESEAPAPKAKAPRKARSGAPVPAHGEPAPASDDL